MIYSLLLRFLTSEYDKQIEQLSQKLQNIGAI